MSRPLAEDLFACPECGALGRGGVSRCWLCGAELGEEVFEAELVPEPPPVQAAARIQFSIAGILIVMTLSAVIFAVWSQEPGLGFTLLIITAPAILATLVRTARHHLYISGLSESNLFD